MREILFRGFYTCEDGDTKVFVNGEWNVGKWVYGGYFTNPRGQIFISDMLGASDAIPETVGQYTGRQKVYEYDIVKFNYFGNVYIGKVVFNEKTCGFEIWYNSIVGAYGEKATHKMNFANVDKIEIIGNVFDNPDYIK